MQQIIDQSLATGFIPMNTRQQRASLPFKPGVLERKVHNNDDITFFSIKMFAKPSCDVLQQSSFRSWAATHYHTPAWQTFIHGKNVLSSYWLWFMSLFIYDSTDSHWILLKFTPLRNLYTHILTLNCILWNSMYLELLWIMEHLLFWSKCSIFHNIFKSIQNFT